MIRHLTCSVVDDIVYLKLMHEGTKKGNCDSQGVVIYWPVHHKQETINIFIRTKPISAIFSILAAGMEDKKKALKQFIVIVIVITAVVLVVLKLILSDG